VFDDVPGALPVVGGDIQPSLQSERTTAGVDRQPASSSSRARMSPKWLDSNNISVHMSTGQILDGSPSFRGDHVISTMVGSLDPRLGCVYGHIMLSFESFHTGSVS